MLAAAAPPGLGFVIRWKHLKSSVLPSLRERCVGKSKAFPGHPIEPLTVPAAPITNPSVVARIGETLKRGLFGCCLEEPQPGPLQADLNTQGIKIFSLPPSEIQETAVIDECRMTTLRGSQGPSCAEFYPILKHVALLDEICFLLRFFLACFGGG